MNSVKTLKNGNFAVGGAEELCRGRTVFAGSHIIGRENGVEGTASFYYTPLGMLIRVSVCGLDDGVYCLSVLTDDGGEFMLPPLYAKSGNAWCSALTGKISACRIFGGKIMIARCEADGTVYVAGGGIRPPRIGEVSLRTAE